MTTTVFKNKDNSLRNHMYKEQPLWKKTPAWGTLDDTVPSSYNGSSNFFIINIFSSVSITQLKKSNQSGIQL